MGPTKKMRRLKKGKDKETSTNVKDFILEIRMPRKVKGRDNGNGSKG